ncbi:hypothetical protein Tco_0709706 [Tanacetum coccineum]
MADGKDWSKLVLTDELFEYVLAKYGKGWKNDDAIVDIILYNAEVNVISSDDDALLTDEEITLMGDIPFSTTDDDSDDDENDDDTRDAPLASFDQYEYVRKPTKTKVKVTNYVLSLRDINALVMDVGSSSIRRKSRK